MFEWGMQNGALHRPCFAWGTIFEWANKLDPLYTISPPFLYVLLHSVIEQRSQWNESNILDSFCCLPFRPPCQGIAQRIH